MAVELIRDSTGTSGVLNRKRSEDSENWKQLTNEKAIRPMLLKSKGMIDKRLEPLFLQILNNYTCK
jgi:hypothetical protein